MSVLDMLALTAIDIDDVLWDAMGGSNGTFDHLNVGLESAFVWHGGTW